VALALRAEALAEDCRLAGIVITRFAVADGCGRAAIVIDKRTLARGSAALYRAPDADDTAARFTVESAYPPLRRPFMPPAPAGAVGKPPQ
jgi:hypothetical protein